MAVAQLHLRRYQTFTIGSHTIYLEQVIALFRIVGPQIPAILLEGVVDTGAPMTVFPQKEWQLFQQEIQWLTALNDPAVPRWCRQFSGVSGGTFSSRLGLITVEFFDAIGGRVGPAEIMATFAHDNGRMRDILVGLSGGTFTKRRLELVYDDQNISLSDV